MIYQENLKKATDRQKSNADLKRKEVEFEVGNKIFFKVSPWKKVLQIRKKGRLTPKFHCSLQSSGTYWPVAYF